MTDNQFNSRPSSTAVTPEHTSAVMPNAPTSNTFACLKKPERSIPKAELELSGGVQEPHQSSFIQGGTAPTDQLMAEDHYPIE